MHPRAVLTAATRADLEARPEMLLLPEYDPPSKVAKLLEYAVREGHEGFALE